MDKKTFINSINYEEKNLLSSIYDKIVLSEKVNKVIFLNEFAPPIVWKSVLSLENLFQAQFNSIGIFEDSERQMLCFGNLDKEEFPIKLIKINCKSKFNKISHKDYLGSLMALGIVREKMGDLLVEEDSCYLPVCADISSYIIDNLNHINKSPCKVEILEVGSIQLPKYKFDEKIIIVTSIRIDCIVSSICNLSRVESKQLIDSKKVMLDYFTIKDYDEIVKENAVISIRGFGKFILKEEIGKTQKDRIKLKIKKYI